MSEDDDESFPWFMGRRGRRTQNSPFGWMDRWFSDFDEMFEHMFQDMARDIPSQSMTEKKLPDGSSIRQYGPFVYGYSMSMGPDGKPIVQEFGNVKPSKKPSMFGFQQPALEPQAAREPLVDVMNEPDQVRVVAELPGVEKPEIKTSITENTLTISVDSPLRKYYKEVKLPSHVDTENPKASYNNGVLEIALKKTQLKAKGREIRID